MRAGRGDRATIVDVARAAEVSRQTVSNVVNSPHRVAPATRARVTAEIHRLGFRPNQAARSLKKERAGTWGVQLDTRTVGQLGSILDRFLVELTTRSAPRDHHILPFVAPDVADPMAAYQEILAGQLADGFVLTDTRYEDPRPAWLLDRQVPFAAFGRIWDDPAVTAWVDVDGAAGTEAAVRHLASEGYERIAFLGWPAGSAVGDDRREGWRRAVVALDVGDAEWAAESEQQLELAALAAAPLVEVVGSGGAIVCASDALALGAWRSLHERGLRPGLDIGLVGFDDSDIAEALDLTSLRQPITEVAEGILGLLAGEGWGGRLLTPPLVARGSSSRSGRVPTPAAITAGATYPAGDRTTTDGDKR